MTGPLATAFGQRLSEALAAKGGTTQRALADLLGVNESAVSNWIAGKSLPTTDKLPQICRRLSISADWLLGVGGLPPEPVDVDQQAELEQLRKLAAVIQKQAVANAERLEQLTAAAKRRGAALRRRG